MEKQYKRVNNYTLIEHGDGSTRAAYHRLIPMNGGERERVRWGYWRCLKPLAYRLPRQHNPKTKWLGKGWEHFTWKLFFRDWL